MITSASNLAFVTKRVPFLPLKFRMNPHSPITFRCFEPCPEDAFLFIDSFVVILNAYKLSSNRFFFLSICITHTLNFFRFLSILFFLTSQVLQLSPPLLAILPLLHFLRLDLVPPFCNLSEFELKLLTLPLFLGLLTLNLLLSSPFLGYFLPHHFLLPVILFFNFSPLSFQLSFFLFCFFRSSSSSFLCSFFSSAFESSTLCCFLLFCFQLIITFTLQLFPFRATPGTLFSDIKKLARFMRPSRYI